MVCDLPAPVGAGIYNVYTGALCRDEPAGKIGRAHV